MTYLETLQATREAVAAAMLAAAAKPDYSIRGQSVQWSSLFARLQQIDALIAAADGPVELETEGLT